MERRLAYSDVFSNDAVKRLLSLVVGYSLQGFHFGLFKLERVERTGKGSE